MSDVITLDSSDEESPPLQKKTKLKVPANPTLSGPQHKQVSQKVAPQQISSKGAPVNAPIKIINSNFAPKNQTLSNTFKDELRKKVRNIVTGIQGGHTPVNIRPAYKPKVLPCNISVQNQVGSLLKPTRVIKQRIKVANAPVRPQGNINPMNTNIHPFILNARSLQKPVAQNVINALPAGITVTRTSANKMPTQKPLMQNLFVKNPLVKKKQQPPKLMETVELDDDEEDLCENTDVVGAQIPIEFDCVGAEELTGDDTKENSSFTTEVPLIEGNEEKTYELTLTNGDEFDDGEDDVSNDQENSTLHEEPKSLDVTEEVELTIETDPLKTILSFYTPKKSQSKESPSSKGTRNDNAKKTLETFIEILDSPVKPKVLEEVKTVVEEIKPEKEENSPETKTNIDEAVDYPIPSPKKDVIVFIPDTPFSSMLVEEKPALAAKSIDIKVNIRLEDVLEVQEFIKKSPIKRIAPTPVVEIERQINETYQGLIDLCFKLDNSDDMKKIIDKKVKAYYLSVQPSFTESKSFCKFVQRKVEEISGNPDCLFLYIKDVVDELKVRRVKNKKSLEDGCRPPGVSSRRVQELQESGTGSADSEGGDSHEEEDSVTNQRIHKLERAMRKLSKAIKKLDNKEIDDNDDENSAYMLSDRYKTRLVRIYNKLCVLTGEHNEARQATSVRGLSRLSLCGGRLPRLSAAVKAAAASKPHWFPDYHDVFRCVEHCAKEQGLAMRPDMLHSEAREAFLEIGSLLQERRRAQEYEDLSWRLGMHTDPAEHDPELATKLMKNRELSKHREMEVLNKFAEKQSNLKLVGEDVAENDADKSEGSSGDSEEDDTYEKKEDDEREASNTSPAEDTTDKSKERNTSPEKNKETITKSGDKNSEVPEEEAKNESEGNVDLVGDSQLETHAIKEHPRKRMLREDSNDSSSMSLIELSSSDSQDSLKSEHEPEKKRKRTESDRDFKRLESIRPTSAMSGINLIEDGSSSCSRFASNKDSFDDDRFKSIAATNSSDVIMEVEDSNDFSEAPSKRDDVTNHVNDNAMDVVENENSIDLRETEKTDDREDALSSRGTDERDLLTKDNLEVIDNVIESNESCSLSNEANQIKIDHVESLQNRKDSVEARSSTDIEIIDNEDDNDTLILSLPNHNDINNLLEARCSEVSEIGDEAHVICQNTESDIETDTESITLFYDEKDLESTDEVCKTVLPNVEEVATATKAVVDESSSDTNEIRNSQPNKADELADDTLCEVGSGKSNKVKASRNSEVETEGSDGDQGIYEGEIDIFEHEISEAV